MRTQTTWLLTLLAGFLLCARPADAQEHLAPGSPIGEGMSLDVTTDGFNYLLSQLEDFIPPDLVIGSTPPQEVFSLFGFCPVSLQFDNLVVHTELQSIEMDASPAGLSLSVALDFWLNTPEDPAIMEMFGDCMVDYVCLLHTDPVTIEMDVPVVMAMSADVNGDPFIDVELGPVTDNIQEVVTGENIHLSDCAVGDLNDLLGGLLIDLLIGGFTGDLTDTINEQLESLEPALEEAFLALWIQDSTALLDTELSYDIHPTEVEHNNHGLRLVMGGQLSSETAECVAAFEDPGSLYTASDLPGMTSSVPDTGAPYHLAALLSDDFVNQALHAAWRGGTLCQVVEDLGSTELSTTYLGLLLGPDNADRITELLGGDGPMLIRTIPETAPVARFDGDHDLEVRIEGLNIEFYPLVQDRFARLVSVAIDIAASVDISLAPDDALQLDIFLDTDELNPRVTYNEIAEDLNPAFEENFAGFVGVVIDTVAGSFLEGMAFGLPTINLTGDDDDSAAPGDDDDSSAPLGIGLTGLEVLAVGQSSSLLDFLALYASLGETTGGTGSGCDGCGGDSGCDDSGGCGGDSGCGGDGGCGDLGGCNIEDQLADAGCSGETSSQPEDTGCQGCRLVARKDHRGHWRILVSQGTGRVHPPRGIRAGLAQTLLVVGPILLVARRRRRHDRSVR